MSRSQPPSPFKALPAIAGGYFYENLGQALTRLGRARQLVVAA